MRTIVIGLAVAPLLLAVSACTTDWRIPPDSLQVTCVVPDETDADQRIDLIGGEGWRFFIDDAIRRIDSGQNSFWAYRGRTRARIVVDKQSDGRRYLKTRSDSMAPNTLLSLPGCP